MRIAIDCFDTTLINSFYSGKSLAQRLFDAAASCKYTQRIVLLAPNSMRGKITESWYTVPLISTQQNSEITTTSFGSTANDALISTMRKCNWSDVVLIDPRTPLLFGFMLDEICSDSNQIEYFLSKKTWESVVKSETSKYEQYLCSTDNKKYSEEDLNYLFSEMDAGASWDDLM